MATRNLGTFRKLSIASTLVDAAMAFYRGRYKRGAVLVGAAALSARVPGFGTGVSILSRVFDRMRARNAAP